MNILNKNGLFFYCASVIISALSLYSCTSSTEVDDSQTLNKLLYGTYHYAIAGYSPNPDGLFNEGILTDSSYLTLNSNGSFKMRLEILVNDTTYDLFQNGSYKVISSTYNDPGGFVAPYWSGTLQFYPNGQVAWSVDFSISEYYPGLDFIYNVFELPDSSGYIQIFRWYREKPQ